jgi:hypothetical protein
MRIPSFVLLFLATTASLGAQTMNHDLHKNMPMASPQVAPATNGMLPTEAGQSAFAAIQEIVLLLESDPKTNWATVDIEGLRQHLIDMSNVTLGAAVTSEPIDGGIRFTVTGDDTVQKSIQRMVMAHAETMTGSGTWPVQASVIPTGAVMTVRVTDPADLAKLRGLGFIGVMTRGMHHQMHHLLLARGSHPHN